MPPAAPWTLTAPPRRTAWSAAGAVILLLLAAWTVPPLLDWGRFRTQIAALATARLGRPVVIGGDISLRLLPHAVLTAANVTLPDQGDGISGQVSALRLQVATLPLLTGRIVLRDLVLGAPVLRLPMTLPGGLPDTIAHPSRPLAPHAFAARIENGVLRIGQTEISGITAAIHGGPETPPGVAAGVQEVLTPDAAPVAAFGAEGFADASGRTWRFTAALGVPNADGVSPIDISVHGQGAVADTGATVQGTLADGAVQGRLRAGGPNLSLLMPASPLAWHAEAPFVATAQQVETTAISLSLGGAPADGALVLRLATPARLEGRLHAATLDLNGWAALLGTGLRLHAESALAPARSVLLPLRIALSADTATLLAGTLRDLRATLVSDGTHLGFDQDQVTLPGDAMLAAAHASLTEAAGQPAGISLLGTATLTAPDLSTTLAWLRPLAPSLLGAIPPGTLRQADLAGAVSLGADGLSVTNLAGRIDGTPARGAAAIRPGPRPKLDLTLALDTLPLDPWLAGITPGQDLAAFGQSFTTADATLHIKADKAIWHGEALTALVLDARTGSAGLVLDQAQATLAGARVIVSGTAATDGSLSAATLSVQTQELAPLLPLLPQSLRTVPALWHGPATLRLTANGPPDALALQLRADAGDLVLEGESVRNTRTSEAEATLTVRHPGAPRLAAALGFPGGLDAAIAWLDTGSLALLAHLHATPGHLIVQDYDVNAASLRLSGNLNADWTGRTPIVTGAVTAENLPLPAWPALSPLLAQLSLWSTHFHIAGQAVSLAHTPLATVLSANLETTGGVALLDALSATTAGGHLAGQLAANVAASSFAGRLTLTDAKIAGPLTSWPVDIDQGTADISADLSAGVAGWSTLRGQARATLHDARLTGLGPNGTSPNMEGTLDATIDAGKVVLTPAQLTSPDSNVAVTGTADAAASTIDVRLIPSGSSVVDLDGRWGGPKVTVEAKKKAASSSFLKKRTKKLLPMKAAKH
jgi:hypothetical protein